MRGRYAKILRPEQDVGDVHLDVDGEDVVYVILKSWMDGRICELMVLVGINR